MRRHGFNGDVEQYGEPSWPNGRASDFDSERSGSNPEGGAIFSTKATEVMAALA